MLKIILLISILFFYILFPKIHSHDVVIEEMKILYRSKWGIFQILIFVLFPISVGVVCFFIVSDEKIKDFYGNIGNYLSIISIFCGFLLNISVFLDSVLGKIIEKRKMTDIEDINYVFKEINTIINYTLLIGFIFLMFCAFGLFFGINKYITASIVSLGIHFFLGIIMIYRNIYLLTKNSY